MKIDTNPKISFIIPILNEEKSIKQCLDSLLHLDYPLEDIEILLAQGKSTDNTDTIIETYKKTYPNIIKTFENPSGNTAIGRNICIDHAKGSYIMNYSGHVTSEKNLLKVLIEKHLKTPEKVVSVGCANVSPEKQNFVAHTASVVFSSFIGGKNIFVQNAEFAKERYSDHISFALYRKKPVVEVGKFDPEFWCGQDAELDLRLLKKGYKILFTPDTKVYHYKRSTVKALFKQMYRYGIARAKMSKKHPRTLKVFHLIGSGFIIGLILVIILIMIHLLPIWFPVLLAVLYILATVGSTAQVTKDISSILASPIFAFIIHVGYGLGFLRGLIYGKL